MTTTPTATRPADLAQLTAAAEQAAASAAEASAKASAAYAAAQLAGERARLEQDARFCRWASARLAASNATLARLAAEVDDARKAFERAVAAGDAAFVALYLDWATCAARLYHHRGHVLSLQGQLHLRKPAEYAAADGSRSTNDSRTTIPSFADALDRAVAHAVAARSGDAEDELQNALQNALRGEVDDA